MVLYPIRPGRPTEPGEVGKYNKHVFDSEMGNFNTLVWRCRHCDGVRVKGSYFDRKCPKNA